MRTIANGIRWTGAIDWHRRVFDALIPIPDGTSYNAYLVEGADKTALLDTVDPSFRETLLGRLKDVPRIDYVVAHHAEPDHSGCLPDVMRRYPEAELICTPKARDMLLDLLPDLPPDRIRPVGDGERIDLGGRTLQFVHVPWVHWPETMMTFLEEERALFSCDFFGSHLATSALWASADDRTLPSAKLYYAQIMMPYANVVRKDLDKAKALDPAWIAPSHGPLHDRPASILEAYDAWLNAPARRRVVIGGVSTHGSTAAMAAHLVEALIARGVEVESFDLAALPLDRFASSLVDAGAVIFAAPAIWNAPHPAAVMAMYVTAGLKPKAKVAGLIGSYGWSPKALSDAAPLLPGLKAEILPSVLAKGAPRAETFQALDALTDTLAMKLV